MEPLIVMLLILGFIGISATTSVAMQDDFTGSVNALREVSAAQQDAILEKIVVLDHSVNNLESQIIVSNYGVVPVTIIDGYATGSNSGDCGIDPPILIQPNMRDVIPCSHADFDTFGGVLITDKYNTIIVPPVTSS